MVFIIPSSRCLAVDIKNVARQMINIEQNAQLFSSEVKPCNGCSCVDTGEHIIKNATTAVRHLDNSALTFVGSKEKVNIYSIPNPVYPEHPVVVEPISMVGTVLIYLPKVLGCKINNKVTISNKIRDEVDRVLLEYFRNSDIDFKETADASLTYNGIYYESELDSKTATSRFTIVSKPYDININRKIMYRNRSAVYSAGKDTFIWNIRIITEGDLSIYNFLNVTPRPNGNCCASPLVYSKLRWLNDQFDKGSPHNMTAQDTVAHKVFLSLNSYINDSTDKWCDISYMMYAPNLVVLDCAGLLTEYIKQQGCPIIKQLNNPELLQYRNFKYIDLEYDWRSEHGIDRAIETEYVKDYNIVPKFDITHISESSKFLESLLKSAKIRKCPNIDNQTRNGAPYLLTQTDLYRGDYTYDVNGEQVDASVYHLQFACREPTKSDGDNAEFDCTLSANLKQVTSLAKRNAKLKKPAVYLNEPDQVCFITGTPLWDYYFEFQFVCSIKISPRRSQSVIVCMSLSKRGLLLLYRVQHRNLYPDTDRVIHYRGFEFDKFVIYLLNIRHKYACGDPNIVIKKADKVRSDVLALLKNKKNRYLLESMDKFGIVHYADNLYVVNPETNDIFIGINASDITDQFILEMKNSDAYFFKVVQ